MLQGTKYLFINHTFNKHDKEIRVTILSNTNFSNENTMLPGLFTYERPYSYIKNKG